MLDHITELNDPSTGNNVNGFDLETSISFPADDELTVGCTARVLSAYPNISTTDSYVFFKEATVRSKNIYEDIPSKLLYELEEEIDDEKLDGYIARNTYEQGIRLLRRYYGITAVKKK